MHNADVPVKILTVDEAAELFGFPETAKPLGKTAFQMVETGTIAFVSGDESDEWIASGRWELAEEFIFSAIRSGKLRLLGRPRSERPRNSAMVETVELSAIDPQTVRERVIDRWDGELVLVNDHDEAEEDEEDEFVDLHIFEEDLLAIAGDLFAYRNESKENGVAAPPPTNFGVPVLVHPAAPTVGAETECGQWFRTEIPEVPENGPGKRAMWEEARQKFGGRLSYRAFSRVWDQCAPTEWKRAGRKPGRND